MKCRFIRKFGMLWETKHAKKRVYHTTRILHSSLFYISPILCCINTYFLIFYDPSSESFRRIIQSFTFIVGILGIPVSDDCIKNMSV